MSFSVPPVQQKRYFPAAQTQRCPRHSRAIFRSFRANLRAKAIKKKNHSVQRLNTTLPLPFPCNVSFRPCNLRAETKQKQTKKQKFPASKHPIAPTVPVPLFVPPVPCFDPTVQSTGTFYIYKKKEKRRSAQLLNTTLPLPFPCICPPRPCNLRAEKRLLLNTPVPPPAPCSARAVYGHK